MNNTNPLRLLALALLLVTMTGCQLAATQLLARFTLQVEPEALEITAGRTGNVTLRADPQFGLSLSQVNVTLQNPPAGITAAERNIFPRVNANWTINVAPTVTPGEYELEIQAVSSGANLLPEVRTKTIELTVRAPQ